MPKVPRVIWAKDEEVLGQFVVYGVLVDVVGSDVGNRVDLGEAGGSGGKDAVLMAADHFQDDFAASVQETPQMEIVNGKLPRLFRTKEIPWEECKGSLV